MNYYICAFSNVIRYSGKVSDEEAAARNCFGIVDRVTVLNLGKSSHRYRNREEMERILDTLIKKHCAAYGFDPSEFSNCYRKGKLS